MSIDRWRVSQRWPVIVCFVLRFFGLFQLSRIEKELRESQHLDEERRREADFLRQQQNQLLWQNLCYLSLSQRIAKYAEMQTPEEIYSIIFHVCRLYNVNNQNKQIDKTLLSVQYPIIT